MEHTLGEAASFKYVIMNIYVLILVLMEHTLGVSVFLKSTTAKVCLNPCFNGTYSRRNVPLYLKVLKKDVLILVLMEHTLGGVRRSALCLTKHCLNPCFNGTYSRRMSLLLDIIVITSLNPCFNGTYSRRGNLL